LLEIEVILGHLRASKPLEFSLFQTAAGITRNSASLEIKAFPGFFVSFLLEIDRVLEILIAS